MTQQLDRRAVRNGLIASLLLVAAIYFGSGRLRHFDPALMKVFVNTLGLYPIGTVVRLHSGEIGVVIYGGGEGERLNHPIITLIGSDGSATGTLDLAEQTADGRYRWSIAMTEDPAKYGIQPSGIIAASAGVGD